MRSRFASEIVAPVGCCTTERCRGASAALPRPQAPPAAHPRQATGELSAEQEPGSGGRRAARCMQEVCRIFYQYRVARLCERRRAQVVCLGASDCQDEVLMCTPSETSHCAQKPARSDVR